jgi:hypothetical protein
MQVAGAVIVLISIYVMDNFARPKLSVNQILFSNPPMNRLICAFKDRIAKNAFLDIVWEVHSKHDHISFSYTFS